MHSPGITAFGEKLPGNLMRSDAPLAEAVPQSPDQSLPLWRRPSLPKQRLQTAAGEKKKKADEQASQNLRR